MPYYVYKITNRINGKLYVGCTINPCEQRWKVHRNAGLNPNSPGYYDATTLHRAMHKHGVDNFSFEVLEECSENIQFLRDKEREWIRKLNCRIPNGYNVSVRILTDEQIAIIRFNVLSLKQKEYAKLFGVSTATIYEARTGKVRPYDPYAYITRDYLPEDITSYISRLGASPNPT